MKENKEMIIYQIEIQDVMARKLLENLESLNIIKIRQKKEVTKSDKTIPQFGCAKGTFEMSVDFDEPLDDFKDYMP